MIEEMDQKYSKLKLISKEFTSPFLEYQRNLQQAEEKVLLIENQYNLLVTQF